MGLTPNELLEFVGLSVVDPSQARRILAAFDCRVQRTAEGVRLVWPDAVAMFFADSAIP